MTKYDPFNSSNLYEITDPKDEVSYLAKLARDTKEARKEEEAIQEQDVQYKTTQQDARDNPEGWGLKGLAKEAQSILSGGLQDTATSLAT